MSGIFRARGDRASSQRVLLVPHEMESAGELESAVRQILLDSPTQLVVEVPSSASSLPCDPRILYYGARRPAALPTECEWQRTQRWPNWATMPTREMGGGRTLVGRIAEAVSKRPLPDSLTINFSGGLPTVAAAALLSEARPQGVFAGRIVWLSPSDGAQVETPYGLMSHAMVRAEAVSSFVDDAHVRRSLPLALVVVLLTMVAGAFAAPPVAWARACGPALWLVALAAFFLRAKLWNCTRCGIEFARRPRRR